MKGVLFILLLSLLSNVYMSVKTKDVIGKYELLRMSEEIQCDFKYNDLYNSYIRVKLQAEACRQED